MHGSSRFRLSFSVAGIPVHLQWSGLLLSGLLGLSFFQRYQASESAAFGLALAVLGGLSFTLSILLHELGHAFEARHRDQHVTGVTLFLLGGVTQYEGRVKRPWDEFAIAAIGPFVNILLAAVLGILATAVGNLGLGDGRVVEVLGTLAWLNLALAAFNLIPGAPLDGGRMLRAGLWRVLGDREKAVRGSARIGQGISLALGLLGLWSMRGETSTPIDGIWLLFIALFMWQAATSEHRTSQQGDRLRARLIASLPDPPPLDTLDADWTVEQALAHVAHDAPGEQVHLTARRDDHGWEAVGAVRVADLRALAPADRSVRRADDVAVSLADLPAVPDTRSVADLVDVLQANRFALTRNDVGAPQVWTLHRVVLALEAKVAP